MNLKELHKHVADKIAQTQSSAEAPLQWKQKKEIMNGIQIRLPAYAHAVGSSFELETDDKASPYLSVSFFVPPSKKKVFSIFAEMQQSMIKYNFGNEMVVKVGFFWDSVTKFLSEDPEKTLRYLADVSAEIAHSLVMTRQVASVPLMKYYLQERKIELMSTRPNTVDADVRAGREKILREKGHEPLVGAWNDMPREVFLKTDGYFTEPITQWIQKNFDPNFKSTVKEEARAMAESLETEIKTSRTIFLVPPPRLVRELGVFSDGDIIDGKCIQFFRKCIQELYEIPIDAETDKSLLHKETLRWLAGIVHQSSFGIKGAPDVLKLFLQDIFDTREEILLEFLKQYFQHRKLFRARGALCGGYPLFRQLLMPQHAQVTSLRVEEEYYRTLHHNSLLFSPSGEHDMQISIRTCVNNPKLLEAQSTFISLLGVEFLRT